MRVFLVSIALLAAISVGSAVILEMIDMSAQQVYSSPSTRF